MAAAKIPPPAKDASEEEEPSAKKAKLNTNPWSMKLFEAMKDSKLLVDDSNSTVVVIRDAFPKSNHHYLVLPREVIPGLRDLTKEHLKLLRQMKAIGEEVAEDVKKKPGNDTVRFRLGYHANPSMRQLHMHVISQDFDSECLKIKKHWNSFTTAFFLDAGHVIGQIEEDGFFRPNRAEHEALLKTPLKCHLCPREPKNMPELKRHLHQHRRHDSIVAA